MRTTKLITKLFTAMLFMALCFAPAKALAQKDVIQTSVVKDGYVMTDGKMMALTSGKLTPMKKNVVMENGTKISKKGSVKVKGSKRVKMKNGNCVDYTGTIENCNVNSQYFTCTEHKGMRAEKDGKCPKCGKELVKKN